MTRYLILLSLAACTEHNLGNSPEPIGDASWSLSFGGPAVECGTSIAFDRAGDVVAAGLFNSPTDFGTGPVTPVQQGSSWIVKRAATDGAPIWSKTIDGAEVYALVTDSERSVLVVGAFRGAVDFGGETLNASDGGFIAKYTSAGSLAWARAVPVNGSALATSVAVDSTDRVYVTASFTGVLTLPDTTLLPVTENTGLIMALDGDGTSQWMTTAPLVGGIVATADDHLVVTGTIDRPATYGGVSVRPNADASQLVMKITRDGALVWMDNVTADFEARQSGAIAAGPDGGVAAISNPVMLGSPGVAMVAAQGMPVWSRTASESVALAEAVAVTATGTVITGGSVVRTGVDFGGGMMTAPMFLIAHDSDGTLVQARAYGDEFLGREDHIRGIATAPDGRIAFVGRIDQGIDFGAGRVPFAGGSDAVIVVIAPEP